MTFSFEAKLSGGVRSKPLLNVLTVRPRENPEAEPIAWLLVEFQETTSFENISVILSYEVIKRTNDRWGKSSGTFHASYTKYRNSVSLTSSSPHGGALFLNLMGLDGNRIGTYLMNEIVAWAKKHPDASVDCISLSSNQSSDDNKLRRNNFYEQFKIEFEYADDEHKSGISKPMLAGQLETTDAWEKNIKEHDVQEFIREQINKNLAAKDKIATMTNNIANLREELGEAKQSPMRWALKMLWHKYQVRLMMLMLSVLAGSIAWVKLNGL